MIKEILKLHVSLDSTLTLPGSPRHTDHSTSESLLIVTPKPLGPCKTFEGYMTLSIRTYLVQIFVLYLLVLVILSREMCPEIITYRIC